MPPVPSVGLIELDLSTARTDEIRIVRDIDWLVPLSVPDALTIKTGTTEDKPVSLARLDRLPLTGVERIYFSNAAGTGTAELLTGRGKVAASASSQIVTTLEDLEAIGGTTQTGVDLADLLKTSDLQGSTLSHGQETVATAGTAVQFNGGTSLGVPDGLSVKLTAPEGNTGTVYVGGSGVTASNGLPIDVGDVVPIDVDDVSTLYVDADNNGDIIGWLVEAT